MRNIPYWLNIGSILHQYGCATRVESPAINLGAKLKFIAFISGSQNYKSRTRDPFSIPFDVICIFSIVPPVVNLPVKFDANICIGCRYMAYHFADLTAKCLFSLIWGIFWDWPPKCSRIVSRSPNTKMQERKEAQRCDESHNFPDHPRCATLNKVVMWIGVPDVVNRVKFHQKTNSGFWLPQGSRKRREVVIKP